MLTQAARDGCVYLSIPKCLRLCLGDAFGNNPCVAEGEHMWPDGFGPRACAEFSHRRSEPARASFPFIRPE